MPLEDAIAEISTMMNKDCVRSRLTEDALRERNSLADQIRQRFSTADTILPVIDLFAKEDRADRMCKGVDDHGDPTRSYMLRGEKVETEVFRITERPNQTVYQSKNPDGTAEASKTEYFDIIDGQKVITNIRSVINDDNGKPVIIDREGVNGTPQIKLDGALVTDQKAINGYLEKEAKLLTPPTLPERNRS